MPAVPLQRSVGLNGANQPEDVIAVKNRLIELGFDWLAPASATVGPLTLKTIKLFQAIKNGLDVVNNLRNDGVINVGGDTHRWLQAANAPRWRQMPLGSEAEGYFNSEVEDGTDNHDFGTNWLADTISETGATYRDSFLGAHPNAALLTVNDASKPQGGDTPAHAGHETGLVCDIRLPRRDGGVGGITTRDASYDRAAMRMMLIAFRGQPLFERIFLIDDQLISEGLCRPLAGHDNHAHFEILPPLRVDDV